jgi:hypothetical protein
MRPKPTREWVMTELERLGVRVVSGRLGRKAGEEDEIETNGKQLGGSSLVSKTIARILLLTRHTKRVAL